MPWLYSGEMFVGLLVCSFFGNKTEKIGRENWFWVNFFLKNRHFLFDNLFILETMRVPWIHACPLEGGIPQKVMWPRPQTSSLPWIPNHVTLNILCQKSPHYGWFYLVLKFFSYHDRKVDFCQDALFKNRLFHVFQLFSYIGKRYYSKKSKYMKKIIFDKRILTKTYLKVVIRKNFQHQVKSPIVWTFLA